MDYSNDPEFSFYIDGRFAATFIGAFPTEDGRYAYEAWRGFGHLDLWRTVDAFGFARCFYRDGADVVYFNVHRGGEYGWLNLSDFERVPKHHDGYQL